MARFVWALVIGSVGTFAFAQAPLARGQTQTTFRSGIDLVQLDVVVLDKQRRPVTGLAAADFTILQDGKRVPIEAFAAVTLPQPIASGVAWLRDIPSDVASNARAESGRLVVIMMDRSIPSGPATVVARAIARSAVDALAPTDMAAVVRTSGFSNEGAPQNFSADKVRLRAAVDMPFVGLVAPPVMSARDGLVKAPPELAHTGDCLCGLCVLETLERVADALVSEGRYQKSILFIGSDILVQEQPQLGGDCSSLIKDARNKALRALDRANVTVHAIDPSGLETLSGGSDYRANSSENPARTLARQGNLAVLPSYTGGRTVTNTNTPDQIVPQIFEESRSYYLIGLQRTAAGREDQRRNLRVVVNRDDVAVRTRVGYYAAEPGHMAPSGQDPAADAIGGLLPKSDLPLALGLTPHFRLDGRVDVSVLVGIGHVTSDGEVALNALARRLDVRVGVFDAHAKSVQDEREVIETPAARGSADVESRSYLSLEPGSYEIRVGVSDAQSGRSGSVYGYVDVPDLRKAALSLSGVAMQVLPEPIAGTPLLIPAVLTAPTVRRTFAADEVVTAFAQLHFKDLATSTVAWRFRILDDQGHVILDQSRPVESASVSDAGVADVHVDVPVKSLKPGRYLLTIEASAGEHHQRRDVPFSIR
jgi:VWFA-related protein